MFEGMMSGTKVLRHRQGPATGRAPADYSLCRKQIDATVYRPAQQLVTQGLIKSTELTDTIDSVNG